MHNAEPQTPRSLGDYTWHEHAACRTIDHHQVDPELFFPAPDEMDRIRAAKALCAQCPVRATCLDAALESGDRDGIRGGMTEEERDPLHRNLQSRLNYDRVNAVLAGRDIHLTEAERQAVVRAAYQAGIPAERLAWLLKVTEEHAEKLYRRTRREIRNRAMGEARSKKGKRRNRTLPDQMRTAAARDDLGTAA